MSLPKELLDQLLTGYLDDALSADERARVDHLLQTDDSVAEELAQLQDLKKSLKAVSLADSDIKLDAGFADRVLGEAVARARAEGLSEDHPLIRLEEQPSKATPISPASSSWRLASVMVGLAASIAFAVIMLRPNGDNGAPDGTQIADTDPTVNVPTATGLVTDRDELGGDSVLVPELIADANVDSQGTDEVAVVAPDSLSPDNSLVAESNGQVGPDTGMESIAVADAPVTQTVPNPTDVVAVSPETHAPRLGAIMVLNVTRTEAGRSSNAVKEAMELASIGSPIEKKITEEVAGFVEAAALAGDGEYSVLYLQAPLRDLDRLYLRLIADEAGIESIGMTLAMKAPVMNLVSNLRQDPKSIRHDQASLQLVSDDAAVAQLAGELGGMAYMSGRSVAAPSSGSDEIGEMLLLVR
ncbi:MAG: anti-sigma factor family protein [Rubripirellula sp.]